MIKVAVEVEALPEVKVRPSVPVHSLNNLSHEGSSAVIVTLSPSSYSPSPEPLLTVTVHGFTVAFGILIVVLIPLVIVSVHVPSVFLLAVTLSGRPVISLIS